MLKRLFLIGIIVLFTGCTSINPAINISVPISSIDQMTSPKKFYYIDSKKNDQHQFASYHIQKATVLELQKKGYILDTFNNADILITHGLFFNEKEFRNIRNEEIIVSTINGIPITISIPRVEVNKFTNGKLTLNFINPKSGKIVWKGFSKGSTYTINSEKEGIKIINEAVKAILEKFPTSK